MYTSAVCMHVWSCAKVVILSRVTCCDSRIGPFAFSKRVHVLSKGSNRYIRGVCAEKYLAQFFSRPRNLGRILEKTGTRHIHCAAANPAKGLDLANKPEETCNARSPLLWPR
jgi:hypothetical protein